MATRPGWIDRFRMIGDTIPMSLPAGGGGGANRVYVDMSDTPTYAVGTRFLGFQEPSTSGAHNRPHWALAENASWLYEKDIAQPDVYSAATAAPGESAIALPVGTVIHLGVAAATAAEVGLVVDILDVNWDELMDGSTPPVQVLAADILLADAGLPLVFSAYPAGGLPATTQTAVVHAIVGQNVELDAGFTLGLALGVSVVNYDQWLRALQAPATYGPPSTAFASISDPAVGVNTVRMHRANIGDPFIPGPGLNWAAGDRLYACHYACDPTVDLTTAIVNAGVTYRVVHAYHTCLGLLPENALTSIKVRTAEEVPFEVERFIMAGLDGAYDQLGFGTAGGGRTINVDSDPVLGLVGRTGEIGFRAQPTGVLNGTAGFMHYNDGGAAVRAGFEDFKLVGLTACCSWPTAGLACTGAGANVLTSPGANDFENVAGDSDICDNYDHVYVTSGGLPFTQAGAPAGIYKITAHTANTITTICTDDATAPIFGAGPYQCYCVRPLMTSGISGNGARFLSQLATLTPVTVATQPRLTAPITGWAPLIQGFAPNASTTAVLGIGIEQSTAGLAGTHFMPERRLGIVGTAVNDADAVVELLDKSSATVTTLEWKFTEPTDDMQVQLTSDTTLGGEPRLHLDLFPLGAANNLEDGANYCDVSFRAGHRLTGAVAGDGSEYRTYFYTGDKLSTGFRVHFEGGTDHDTHLYIKETPVGGAGGIPQTPPTTLTDTTIEHRVEIDHNANIGWSNWRTIYKLGNLTDGYPVAGWTFGFVPPAGAGNLWQHAGGASQDILFPIYPMHGSRLVEIKIAVYAAGACTITGNAYRQTYSAVGAPTCVLIDALATGTFINPGPGAAYGEITLGCNNYQALIESEQFYVTITSGAAAVGQSIYGYKYEFQYVDIFPT